ncbi:hypothetical protein R1sor_000684 [Riccia sorocarpa]|uniref:CHAT domain-containing protein n=1 Tax=Riccia sorocarpa TaxID=122646 RepID=A0ABD3GW67_9MARC
MACFLHEERCSVHLRKALTLTKGAVEKLDRMDKASLPEMSTWIRTLMMLSNMYMKVGQFSEASLTSRRAYEDAKKNLYGLAPTAALAYGAAAVELAELSDAERLYREELQQLKARGYADEVLIARLQGGLGRVLMKQSGRLDEAEAELRQAANACGRFIFEKHLTSHHRIEAFEQLKFLYSELQSCLYSIYKESPDERKGIRARDALIVAEQGRCRDLMFNLENRRGEDSENTGFTLDWKKFDTDAEYAWEQLEECMTVCVNAIKKRNKEVQRVTFVEFTLTFGNLIIWVLQSHGTPELSSSSQAAKDLVPEMFCVDIKDFIIDAKEELPTALEDYKMTYGSELGEHHYSKRLQRSQALEAHSKIEDVINKLRDGDPDDRALNSLYKLLIKPFAKKLGKEEPVIFIPHEGISFVPFAALKGPGMKGKYFIENHPIGTAYSLRSLGWAVNRYTTLRGTSGISSQDQLLLVADPSPLGVNKDPLPQSIQEVNAIASHFPRPSVILSGERATLEEVTSHMSRSSWFHISCHGDVSTEYPQGVLFLSCSGDSEWAAKASRRYAASDYEDLIFNSGGYLTPAVILNNVRWMPAHAAVLAACNVGKGKKAGEGLIGLSRALTQAGVPLVVAPLKSVLSEHASEFMQRLYKKLVAGESMMFALRNTMRDIIESNAAKKKAGEESGWPLWEWAAWLPVGFPGVCLPFCNVTEESPLELDC